MQNKKIWFRRKSYGWGWTPSAWQGWLILIAYIISMFLIFKDIDSVQHSGSDTLINFAPRFILLTVFLIIICYWKGEKPKWTWGRR